MATTSSLDPDKLLSLATTFLPSTSPALTNPTEALALLIHSIHTAVGFRLVHPTPMEGPNAALNALPEGWANGGTPKLRYRHEQSSLEFVVSVVELGGRAMVAAVAVEDNKSVSFDLLLTDYFSLSAFPFSPPSSLSALFSSPTRLTDLITLYRLNILQPLIPGLRKEGYSELPASTSSSTPSASVGGRGGYYPDVGGPLGPYGGGVPQPPRRFPEGERQPNPFPSVGRSDLDPLGGQVPHFTGFPGTRGPTIGPPGGGGNGMLVGPDHPLFRERFGAPEHGGVWGGDGWLPRGAVPPGARFDPIGPGNGPPQPGGVGIGGFGGGRGIGSFYPGRGGGGGGFGGRGGGGIGRGGMDPDPDEFYPPGNGNGNNRMGGSSDYDNMFG